MTSPGWLKSIWPTTSSRDQSAPKIPPLRDKHAAVRNPNNYAAFRRETTGSPVRGTDAGVRGMARLSWPTKHPQNEDRSEERYPDSAIGASIAGTARETKAMTSDTISQRAVYDKTHGYDAEFRPVYREAREDPIQVPVTSPTERQQNMNGWRQLRINHLHLQSLRVEYDEQRARLRIKQQDMQAIEAQFVRKLEKIESVSIEDVKDFVVEVMKHHEILREARSAVALEEAEYEKIEGTLRHEECELRDLESRTYHSSMTDLVGALDNKDDLLPIEEDPTESVVSSQNIRRNQSAEAQRYLSQKGAVDILREQLMDLRVYHSQVTAEQADRRDAGLDPDEALTAFLDGFDQQHEALVLRLRNAEETLAEYEDALQVPEDTYSPSAVFEGEVSPPEGPSRAHSLFGKDDYFNDSIMEARKMEDARLAATTRVFLLTPSDSVSVYRLLENEPRDKPVSRAFSVNSWLLNRLRSSTSEVARLVAEHMNYGLQLDPDDFKEQVLAKWLEDETVRTSDFSKFAVGSHDYSMATVSGNTQNSKPASENALQGEQQNSFLFDRQLSARQTQTER